MARAFLRIEPDSVTVDSINSPAVTVMCRAMLSQNSLTTLVVSHRFSHLRFTVQPTELAVTDMDFSVTDKAGLDTTVITGGLADRLINYTMLEVTL